MKRPGMPMLETSERASSWVEMVDVARVMIVINTPRPIANPVTHQKVRVVRIFRNSRGDQVESIMDHLRAPAAP